MRITYVRDCVIRGRSQIRACADEINNSALGAFPGYAIIACNELSKKLLSIINLNINMQLIFVTVHGKRAHLTHTGGFARPCSIE